MANPRLIPVSTLAEFANAIDELLAGARAATPSAGQKVCNWYRGHSKTNEYKLGPGLYRHPVKKAIKDLVELELSMVDEFERQSLLHSFPVVAGEKNLLSTLFYMQHHGLPTRLLDWTSNPFIALYFALSGAKKVKNKHKEGAAVWVFDPYRWNRHALADLHWGDRGPAQAGVREISSYLPAKLQPGETRSVMYEDAVAIIGTANTPRMLAQKGHFTLFGESVLPMERAFDTRGFPDDALVKLEVAPADIDAVLSVLLAVGYTDSVAYPDLQGVSMEIRRLHGFDL